MNHESTSRSTSGTVSSAKHGLQGREDATQQQETTAGREFLATMAASDGAVKTDSGMVYIETAPGEGASPLATDKVKLTYTGTLRDGRVFDSSGETQVSFDLKAVIPCFTEGS